jgi:hypothetical protein
VFFIDLISQCLLILCLFCPQGFGVRSDKRSLVHEASRNFQSKFFNAMDVKVDGPSVQALGCRFVMCSEKYGQC